MSINLSTLGMPLAMQLAMQQAMQEAKQKEKQNITLTSEPENTEKIKLSADIQDLLLKIEYPKLRDLYKSLCRISLIEHSIVMYVVAWSFFESLSAAMRIEEEKRTGEKKDHEPFNSYFNKKINKWYKEKKGEKKDIKEVLKEISEKGNANKHSAKRHAMSALQLHNDFEVLDDFIIRCINYILEEQSST